MARARPAILADKPSALSEALSFLVRDYEPVFLWWELLEAWKKLFLVGFAVLISPGSIVQLGIAFLFSLIFMLVVSAAAPFKDDGDDLFAKACGFSLTAVFFFSIILKVGVLTEAVDDVLSAQLRSRFGFNAGLVSIGMIGSVLGALVLVAVIAGNQLAAAARVPIIKLLHTKSAPDIPLRPHHRWHMFNSHSKTTPRTGDVVAPLRAPARARRTVWGTGQDQCATIKRQLLLLL